MIKFSTIGQIEKKYPFVDAVVNADVLNGDFGKVESGVFSYAANASMAIMQLEVGDEAGLDKYPIKSGSHVRVIDLAAMDGEPMEIYGAQVPATVNVGDKLVSTADGKLATGGSTAPYFEVTAIIGNKQGIEVKVVAADPSTETDDDLGG